MMTTLIESAMVMVTPPADEESAYLEKMKDILTRGVQGFRASYGPAQLLDHLFLGNKRDAHNLPQLKRQKITHILNCAGKQDYSQGLEDNPYDPDKSGIRSYLQFEALDNEHYPIMRHFKKARAFINDARREGGRVLVHCEMGVNRSAALCLAYVIEQQDLTLIQGLRILKAERPVVLCNEGFRRQLYHFARERGMLHPARRARGSGED